MPLIAPLSHSLLLFFKYRRKNDKGIYDMLPWSNPVFREAVGLEHPNGAFDWKFRASAWAQMSKKERSLLTGHREKIDFFLHEVLKRAIQEPSDWLTGVDDIAGAKEYKDMVTTLLNWRGSVIPRLKDLMESMGATPARAVNKMPAESVMLGAELDEDSIKVPAPGDRLVRLQVPLARLLFGEEAIDHQSNDLWTIYKDPVLCISQRTWQNESRKVQRIVKRRNLIAPEYTQALEAAETKPNPSTLRAAVAKLGAWKELAKITGEIENSKFQDQEKSLERLWGSLGWSRTSTGEIIRSKGPKSFLADKEDMELAYRHYLELCFPSDEEDTAGLFDDLTRSDENSAELGYDPFDAEDGEDLGVEEFKSTNTDEMLQLLCLNVQTGQFPFGRPGSKAINGDGTTEDSPPAKPHWHQLVGTARMLQGFFTKERGQKPKPILLCDDVGVGKTMQVIGAISMLAHIIELQRQGKRLPPLLERANTIYFAGMETIEPRPALIVVPRTLSAQWQQQIALFTERGAFNVIVYSRNTYNRAHFFGPNGDWTRAVTATDENGNSLAHRTIVIAESTSIKAEAAECLTRHTRDAYRIFSGTPEEVVPGSEPTILDKHFLIIAIDEIHMLRNANDMYQGVLRLARNSAACSGMSATPIFTNSTDAIRAATILGYEPAVGQAGVDLVDKMKKSERERRKEWLKPEVRDNFTRQVALSRAAATHGIKESEPGTEKVDPTCLLAGKASVEEDKNLKTYFYAKAAIEMAKETLAPIVVRRTKNSTQPNGQPVLAIQRYIGSNAWVKLRPAEYDAVNAIAAVYFDEESILTGGAYSVAGMKPGSSKDLVVAQFRAFLKHFRDACLHPGLPGQVMTRFWKNWKLPTLEKDASTKLLLVAQIVRWHLNPAAPPMFWRRDTGERDLEAEKSLEWEPATQKRKFLILAVFEVHRAMLKQVFTLNGWKYCEYEGTMSQNARKASIAKFETDESVDIMLISNVGTTGLNITRASVVIFVSGLWSASEEQQTIGRVWRQGQRERVIVYRIFALETADELLSGYANGKALMLERFLGRQDLLGGSEGFESTDEDEDSSRKTPRKRKSAVVRRKRKNQVSSDCEDPTEGAEDKCNGGRSGPQVMGNPNKKPKPEKPTEPPARNPRPRPKPKPGPRLAATANTERPGGSPSPPEDLTPVGSNGATQHVACASTDVPGMHTDTKDDTEVRASSLTTSPVGGALDEPTSNLSTRKAADHTAELPATASAMAESVDLADILVPDALVSDHEVEPGASLQTPLVSSTASVGAKASSLRQVQKSPAPPPFGKLAVGARSSAPPGVSSEVSKATAAKNKTARRNAQDNATQRGEIKPRSPPRRREIPSVGWGGEQGVNGGGAQGVQRPPQRFKRPKSKLDEFA